MDEKIATVLLACLVVVASAAESLDSTALLQRVRARVLENERKRPRYICRQRIVRRDFSPGGRSNHGPCSVAPSAPDVTRGMKLVSVGRVSLDVIIAHGGEMFSWPGMSRFETNAPSDLIRGPGLSASGDFGGFLTGIFDSAGITFHYEGAAGPGAVRFSYDVPQKISTYALRASGGGGIVGYKGSFDVDPRTADLLRLAVETTTVPEGSVMCNALQEIRYEQQSFAPGAFVVPSLTTAALFSRSGTLWENRTTYESCRQYGVESVVRFDEDAPAGSPALTSAASQPPPSGTELEITLTTPINSEVNWGGDRIEGISPGYAFRGRITDIEHIYQPDKSIRIGIRFDTVVLNGGEVPIALVRAEPGATGLYAFHKGRKAVLPKGFVSRWRVRTAADDLFLTPAP